MVVEGNDCLGQMLCPIKKVLLCNHAHAAGARACGHAACHAAYLRPSPCAWVCACACAQVVGLLTLFRNMDTDNDGVVSLSELCRALEQRGVHVSDEHAKVCVLMPGFAGICVCVCLHVCTRVRAVHTSCLSCSCLTLQGCVCACESRQRVGRWATSRRA